MIKESTLLFLCAFSYLNTPYRYGANGPKEFDCSGLIVKCIRDYYNARGKKALADNFKDKTAQMLYDWAIDENMECQPPDADCLIFYGKSVDEITHVALKGPQDWVIEAGGAGRETWRMDPNTLKEYATKKDAKVRLRTFGHRRDMVASIKLELETE